ncbi:MAG: response regulator [Spirochaetes bacterium]|nr:response regulator [Spirochaetota bacterium]
MNSEIGSAQHKKKLSTTNYSVFLVDDDEKILQLYKSYFKKFNKFKLYTFSNELDALSQISLIKPDLLLLDIFLSRLDGFKVNDIIRKNHILDKTKIIAISSVRTVQDKALLSGIDDYFYKGDYLHILYMKIQKILGRSKKNESGNKTSTK